MDSRYHHRLFLFDILPAASVCAEIGVWKGSFSEVILEKARPEKLHLIDPWAYRESYEGAWYGGDNSSAEQMEAVYQEVTDKMADPIKKNRVKVHRGDSKEILETFEDDYFDWVYIDGDHTYEAVLRDIKLSIDKIKPLGYIAGDDYGEGGWWEGGVKRAVDEMAEQENLELLRIHNGQFILKILR